MLQNDSFIASSILGVFGSNVQKARLARKMSVNSLAVKTGYDRGCLAKLEDGLQNLKYKTAVRLAEALDVPFPLLFSRSFMDQDQGLEEIGPYQKDDHLLVFRENVIGQLNKYRMPQLTVTDLTGLSEQMVSRFLCGKTNNPTLTTLYSLSYAISDEMHLLFCRGK